MEPQNQASSSEASPENADDNMLFKLPDEIFNDIFDRIDPVGQNLLRKMNRGLKRKIERLPTSACNFYRPIYHEMSMIDHQKKASLLDTNDLDLEFLSESDRTDFIKGTSNIYIKDGFHRKKIKNAEKSRFWVDFSQKTAYFLVAFVALSDFWTQ